MLRDRQQSQRRIRGGDVVDDDEDNMNESPGLNNSNDSIANTAKARRLLSIDPLAAQSHHSKNGNGDDSDSSMGSKGLDDLLKKAKSKSAAGERHPDDASEMSSNNASFRENIHW